MIDKIDKAIKICDDQILSQNGVAVGLWQEVRDTLCFAKAQFEDNRQVARKAKKIGLHKGQICAFVSANEFLLRMGAEAYRRGEMDTATQIRKQVTSYDDSIEHHQDNLERLSKELTEELE